MQYLFLVFWKTLVMGPLVPGRRLAGQWTLLRYRVYLNLQRGAMWVQAKAYFHSTAVANPLLRLLGAKLGCDVHVDGITGRSWGPHDCRAALAMAALPALLRASCCA